MAKGLALAIGLNLVDPKHYQGWDGQLAACEFDANDMAEIAKAKGFKCTVLLTKAATRKAVAAAIRAAAKKLVPGDIFLVSYSGHGGQLPDVNGDEDDGVDETWCLYDGELVDDEIYKLLALFKPGVRVLSLSDSCHSGTVIKNIALARSLAAAPGGEPVTRYRAMPVEVAQRTYLANKAFYDPILKDATLKGAQDKVRASCLLISGCQDNQFSADGVFNGLFTGTMKTVWNGGKFSGGYRKFHKAILQRMPTDQTPEYFWVGPANPAFAGQKPYTV